MSLRLPELLLPYGVVRYEESRRGSPYGLINWGTVVVYVLAAAVGTAVIGSAGTQTVSVVGGLGPAAEGETVTAVLPVVYVTGTTESGGCRKSAAVQNVYIENDESCRQTVTGLRVVRPP